MGKASISNSYANFQLISLSIELVHIVLGLNDEQIKNKRAKKIATEWNDLFIKAYVTKEGK